MMKKMGIEQKDVEDVKEVIIRFSDKEWVIKNPQVAMIKQAGSETYQIGGSKTERGLSGTSAAKVEDVSVDEETPAPEIEIPMEDAALVAGQTGVDIETAKEALKETDGDLAAAILKLRR